MRDEPWSAMEKMRIRQAIQVASAAAIMDTRRWRPGEIFFQGGTSLHLVHGSPRWSEDLDFLISEHVDPAAIYTALSRNGLSSPALSSLLITVERIRGGQNPGSCFVVAASRGFKRNLIKVKLEMWQAPDIALDGVRTVIDGGGSLDIAAPVAAIAPITMSLDEIMADKVFAMAARPYVKPRDIFDIAWLRNRRAGLPSLEMLERRFRMYPGMTVAEWTRQAVERITAMPSMGEEIHIGLQPWLPWPVDRMTADQFIASSLDALRHGLFLVAPHLAPHLAQQESLALQGEPLPGARSGPQAPDPEASDPEAPDPEASDPEASDPEASDPEASDHGAPAP